jgi:hypothetical protein
MIVIIARTVMAMMRSHHSVCEPDRSLPLFSLLSSQLLRRYAKLRVSLGHDVKQKLRATFCFRVLSRQDRKSVCYLAFIVRAKV